MMITDDSNEGPEFRKIQDVANLFRISRSTAFRMMKEQGWAEAQVRD